MDIVRAKYHSKINLSNVYKQVRIEPEDIHKMGFATIYGTHESNVMQQGDCNAPATFQWLVTVIFQDEIGIYIHVYLDNLFVFSITLEEHEKHLECVFQN